MSIYSGKCDLYDSAVMIGGYDIDKIRLFISKGERSYPLRITEPRDLIPYYPYVPGMSTYSKETGYKAWISNSYVDVEERERLEFELKELIREYKRAKRKHEPFEPKCSWYNQAIIDRVKEQGTKATIEGIHLPLSNDYRKTLAEEMEKNGYEDLDIIKWVYPDNWIKKLTTGWDWRTDEY